MSNPTGFIVSLDGFKFTYFVDEKGGCHLTQVPRKISLDPKTGKRAKAPYEPRTSKIGSSLYVPAASPEEAVLRFNKLLSINRTAQEHKVQVAGPQVAERGDVVALVARKPKAAAAR